MASKPFQVARLKKASKRPSSLHNRVVFQLGVQENGLRLAQLACGDFWFFSSKEGYLMLFEDPSQPLGFFLGAAAPCTGAQSSDSAATPLLCGFAIHESGPRNRSGPFRESPVV
jgi:hypothetical protein